MALSKPILNTITSFDVTDSKNITFVVSDGDLPVRAIITITTVKTGDIKTFTQDVSSSTNEYSILLPANTLTEENFGNNVAYTANVATYNYQGQISIQSDEQEFTTYTNPTINITSPEQAYNSSQLITSFTYEQVDGEKINYYDFTLFNSIGSQLAYSNTILYSDDSSLQYKFSTNLENGVSYSVQIHIVTTGGTDIKLKKTFIAQYIEVSDFYPLLVDTTPLCKYGYVTVQSEIVAFDGVANPDPPTYIDNDYVSLTESGSYVLFNKGFNIDGNLAIALKFNNPEVYKTKQYGDIEHSIVEMRQNNKAPFIIINMIEDFTDSSKIYAEVCVIDNPFYYRVYTDSITKVTDLQDYKLLFKRIDGLYDVELKAVNKQ